MQCRFVYFWPLLLSMRSNGHISTFGFIFTQNLKLSWNVLYSTMHFGNAHAKIGSEKRPLNALSIFSSLRDNAYDAPTLGDGTTYLQCILAAHQAANSRSRVFPAYTTFIDYKAIWFKEIALITGWSVSSLPL